MQVACYIDMIRIIIIFCSFSPFSLAQNLVPNSSFEDYKKLPCKLNEFFIQDLLNDWSQPLPTSTDYWNTLSNTGCEMNPQAIGRFPRTGSGMIGMITAVYIRNFSAEYKEYAQTQLKDSLRKGHFYYGEIYALNKNLIGNQHDILTANNLGMAFTEQPISDFRNDSPDHLLLKTKIKTKSIVEADGQWHKVGGCFLADRSYQNLLVGNFDSIDSTNFVRLTNTQEFASAYHFIDDVSVVELPYKVSSLEKEMIFCPDQPSVVLKAFVPGATGYQWQDGTNLPTYSAKAKSNTIYTVNISFNECVYKHSFKVNYVPGISLGPDTVLCRQEILKLNPGPTSRKYQWSDGSTDSVRFISTPGTYWVEVLDAKGCNVRDTLSVSYINCPGFVPNVFTPNGDEHNQMFVVENIENRQWSLEVFNRWGQRVYQSDHYKNDWDGKGLSDGIYYYLLYSPSLGKRTRGWVQLLR